MSLSKCSECGKDVSSKAEKCPNCGAPVKSASGFLGLQNIGCLGKIVLVCIGLAFIGGIFGDKDESTNKTKTYGNYDHKKTAPEKQKTPDELRKQRIEKAFSPWDGSHRELERFIKKSMNDPDSYKHEETFYLDKGDYLLVKTTFRGKNAFGGTVKNWIVAKADLDGNIIEIVSQGP
jgi:hypothetical protein